MFRDAIKQNCPPCRERILCKSLHSHGYSGMGGCDDAELASSKVVNKCQADIVVRITQHHLPHIYYYITFTAPLERVHIQDLQTIPVVQVAD